MFDPGVDSYTPGTSGFTATGTPNDYGLQLVLKQGVTGTWSSGWTMEIDLGNNGSNAYKQEIEGCPGWVPLVGMYPGTPPAPCNSRADEDPVKGCVGVKTGMSQGPTRQGVGTLVGLDPTATWNTVNMKVQGGCMVNGTCLDANGNPITISARIVPLALFDPASYVTGGYNGTNGVAKVENLLGFFIEGMCDDVFPNPATRPPLLRHERGSPEVRSRSADGISRAVQVGIGFGRTFDVPEGCPLDQIVVWLPAAQTQVTIRPVDFRYSWWL